jgi:hypothetical protein
MGTNHLGETDMPDYYVNNNPQPLSGDHEVHESGCALLALAQNTQYLGNFPSCHGAVATAKLIYLRADGCAFCSRACHGS